MVALVTLILILMGMPSKNKEAIKPDGARVDFFDWQANFLITLKKRTLDANPNLFS